MLFRYSGLSSLSVLCDFGGSCGFDWVFLFLFFVVVGFGFLFFSLNLHGRDRSSS